MFSRHREILHKVYPPLKTFAATKKRLQRSCRAYILFTNIKFPKPCRRVSPPVCSANILLDLKIEISASKFRKTLADIEHGANRSKAIPIVQYKANKPVRFEISKSRLKYNDKEFHVRVIL